VNLFSRIRFSKEYLFLEEIGVNHKVIRKSLKKKIGISFKSKYYMLKALTHKSMLTRESLFLKSYERLEFLGDAVLDLIVGDFLFHKFPDEEEGFLTKTRSKLVDKNALAEAAKEMNLLDFIIYDDKFLHANEKGIKSITADSLEALIGALYLDRGMDYSRKFVHKWIITPNLVSGKYKIDTNYKGRLLEYAHSKQLDQPVYKLLNEEGPEHSKVFEVVVYIGSDQLGIGKGNNKKEAEQSAARKAYSILNS